ncbi:PadR family transcriptional regulator [Nocardioides luteus]|uniref:PadR family transcriptional regulator n=1 Tax=Nocardioides luteus TaxID=1844 RepID=A0A1J4MY24_9ACTN|nr:PadR family transcriptional regulator [Nocardioides luteus]OIJ24254.1 PadR family transcriptional regulator [Nocardioides luteus]
MARRKVSNLTGLAVLGTVVQRPMHRYEIASLMRARGKGDDVDIKWSSLYTVVANLEKHGLLEVAGTDRQGARPERTIYRITEAGRRELVEWTRELLTTPVSEQSGFVAGLSMMAALTPDQVADALRDRLTALEQMVRELRAAYEEAEIPRLFLVETEYAIAMREAEAAWVRTLQAELTAGTYPLVEEWREWHRSGAMPDELVDLAERGAEQD